MLRAMWDILCESAFFVLLGFAVGGALHVLVPSAAVIRLLSASRTRSVVLASLIGLPLPLCSCGVLPVAVALRQRGASKGATLSFLISTPETSVTSVLLTYSLLGPIWAVFRPIAACITALAAGLVENLVERRFGSPEPAPNAESSCCHDSHPAQHGPSQEAPGWRQRLSEAVRYAFVDLFDDIFGWVLLGVAAAAVIQAFLPDAAVQTVFGGPFRSMLLMAAIGVPLYVCAEASTPIAAALILQGLNPGAAFVFLLCGPATNIGSLGVLRNLLGRRTVVVYVACIVATALAMGAVLNGLLAQGETSPVVHVMHESLVPMPLKIAGAVGFLVLSVVSVRRKRLLDRWAGRLSARLPFPVTGRWLIVLIGALVVAAYFASGLFTVQPGETGAVKRFGAVHGSYLAPGLHYAWPWPIESVDRLAVGRVRRTVVGFKADPRTGRMTGDSDPGQSWSLTGEENLVEIKSAVHWCVSDTPVDVRKFLYRVGDPDGLVRDAVQSAMREALGGESINRVLTARRRAVEEEIEAGARARLDACDSGIRIEGFHLVGIHAPSQVHESFRDVAGAMEDKAATIHQAWGDEAKIIPAARGEARRQMEEARAYAEQVVCLARGESDRFLGVLSASRGNEAVTRRRLYLEMLDKVLPGTTVYVKAPWRVRGEAQIWLVGPGAAGVTPTPATAK
jgi:hypothetical protein